MASHEIPPAALDEKNRILSGLFIPFNKDEPKVSDVPLNVVPLSMIPIPYGGNEPIPFSEQALARLKRKERLSKRKDVPTPGWLKLRDDYVEGDWKAFRDMRSNGHKDLKFIHKEFRREFRSENEVKLFMEAIKTPNPIFRGSELRRQKTGGPDGQDTGYFKSGTTGGKTDNGTGGANVSIFAVMPPGASPVPSE